MLDWIILSQIDFKAEPFFIISGVLLALVLAIWVLERFD